MPSAERSAALRTALLAPSRDEAKKALARHGLPGGTASALLLYAARHQAVLHVAQLPESTAALQKRAVEARTGIQTVPVAICRVCTTIHAKVAGAATPVKKRSGIMMEIGGDGTMRPGRCAACGTGGCIDVVDAVGKEIRARVRHSDAEATTLPRTRDRVKPSPGYPYAKRSQNRAAADHHPSFGVRDS